MKRWLRDNSLSLVLLVLFLVFLFGQSVAGHRKYNEDQVEHHQSTISYGQYLKSGDFVEATFENWESEFLQMSAYVILTVFLYQKGSAESKKLSGIETVDQKPKHSKSKNAPWAVRQGGWILKIYEHSLSLALLLIFVMSFSLHAYGGAKVTCEENKAHGESCVSTFGYIKTSKFWYESFQNWQSEFLAVWAIVIFSVYLREKGSHESKPVNTPNYEHGSE